MCFPPLPLLAFPPTPKPTPPAPSAGALPMGWALHLVQQGTSGRAHLVEQYISTNRQSI